MPKFQKLGAEIRSGALVSPMLKLYIERGQWPVDFNVRLPGGTGERKPDGYFHPSSHPTMSAPELYLYLTDYEKYREGRDPFSGEARISMTVGTILHSLNRTALLDMGLWVQPEGKCPCCHREYGEGKGKCDEPGVANEDLKQRGHMDGILKLRQKTKPIGYDLKTINAYAFNQAKPGLEYFIGRWPKYYGQMQSYMSMRPDLDEVLVLFQQIGYPWGFMEYMIPRDDEYIAALEAKYRRVLDAVAAGQMPGEIEI